MSLRNRPENTIAVVVATVTDDPRKLDLPKMNVCALHFTETARTRIQNAGGKCITLDQLASQRPRGAHTVLVKGRVTARTATKYFGATGVPGSHVRPRLASTNTGRKVERARGRRASRGFKV